MAQNGAGTVVADQRTTTATVESSSAAEHDVAAPSTPIRRDTLKITKPVWQRLTLQCRERLRLSGGDDHRVVDLVGWVASLDAVVELIGGRFGRVEPRRRVGAYLRGLLAGAGA
jgi:hypothetical protein